MTRKKGLDPSSRLAAPFRHHELQCCYRRPEHTPPRGDPTDRARTMSDPANLDDLVTLVLSGEMEQGVALTVPLVHAISEVQESTQ